MFSVRIPGIECLNMDETAEQSTETINFPSFGEFKIPLSTANGNCRTIEEFDLMYTLKDDEMDIIIKCKDLRKNEDVTLIKHKECKKLDDELKDLLRELRILRTLEHVNCLKFLDIAVKRDEMKSTYIVFESLSCYLSDLIAQGLDGLYAESTVKDTMMNLLSALVYLEEKSITHRNIHPGTIAYSHIGDLKITNFREARHTSDKNKDILSSELRYQPPELLLMIQECGPSVDVWSAACIFAQLLLREPLFKINKRSSVFHDIFRMFGVPTEKIWPDFFQFPEYEACVFGSCKYKYNQLKQYFETCMKPQPANIMELLLNMFLYDPKCRYTARDCLQSSYFGSIYRKKNQLPMD